MLSPQRGSSVKPLPWICWSRQSCRDIAFYPIKNWPRTGASNTTPFCPTFADLKSQANLVSQWRPIRFVNQSDSSRRNVATHSLLNSSHGRPIASYIQAMVDRSDSSRRNETHNLLNPSHGRPIGSLVLEGESDATCQTATLALACQTRATVCTFIKEAIVYVHFPTFSSVHQRAHFNCQKEQRHWLRAQESCWGSESIRKIVFSKHENFACLVWWFSVYLCPILFG